MLLSPIDLLNPILLLVEPRIGLSPIRVLDVFIILFQQKHWQGGESVD